MTALSNNQKSKRSSLKLPRVLAVLGMICLTGCLGNSEKPLELTYPPYPVAGAAVVQELNTLNPDEFPALHNWLDRLDILQAQLEVTP